MSQCPSVFSENTSGFPDVFLENFCIFIELSKPFVPKFLIHNKLALLMELYNENQCAWLL